MAITLLKGIIVIITAKYCECTIAGLSYMDPIDYRPPPEIAGSNPCNPLYWYPRNIPEYCYKTTTEAPAGTLPPPPIPLPIPVPLPLPLPAPVPLPGPGLFPPLMPPMPPPPPPFPFGVPVMPPHPMLPIASAPYKPQPYPFPPFPQFPPIPRRQVGMVPGLPGIVSPDGGINVLPFSDVYSDVLEKHKNKLIRKRIQAVIEDYDDYPFSKRHKRLRKYLRRKYQLEE